MTNTTATSLGEREYLARFLGSFPMHDDDRGPDNTVLVDVLPFTPGEDMSGETVLYRIVDAMIERFTPPPDLPRLDLWAWLSARVNLELSWGGDDEDPQWQVHRVSGGVNDREWELIAEAGTVLDAVLKARSLIEKGRP